jgi:hypothetical protein
MELTEIIEEYTAWQAQQKHPDMSPQAFKDHYYTQKVIAAAVQATDAEQGYPALIELIDADTQHWLESQTTGSEIE